MFFSWLAFCKEHRVDFISSGPHSARGNIHVACPWCADPDGTQHMGLSLDSRRPYYGCWKGSGHRGRNPARLVSALLDCSWAEAEAIVARSDSSAVDDYEAAVQRVLTVTRDEPEAAALYLPDTFRPLRSSGTKGARYLSYLEDRGFDDPIAVAEAYGLHYCNAGAFARRLILPIYRDNELVCWTGRDVTGLSKLRYSSLSDKADVAKRQGADVPAVLPINQTVFNYDLATDGGDALVICEGPFDALKVDWFAPQDSHAVAVFGQPKQSQLGAIVNLARNFKRVLVTLDEAAPANAVRLAWQDLGALLGSMVKWLDLPRGVKDPGALTAKGVRALLRA